jgi:hypothetical protein
MATISETELQRRLHKLEYNSTTSKAFVKRVGDTYEYTRDFVHVAYASALSGLSNGEITNQEDATGFQYSPYTTAGALLTYMGHFVSRSVIPSGDPTDYTWESTAGNTGFISAERQYSISTDLKINIGDPQTNASVWTALGSSDAVPSTAVWLA